MRDDVQVVASVGDGGAAVSAAIEHRPDVVLMDYRLPTLDGIQATAQVVEAVSGISGVALTASADDARPGGPAEARAGVCLNQGHGLDESVGGSPQAPPPL